MTLQRRMRSACLVLALGGCATTTTVEPVAGARPAKPPDCEIAVLDRGTSTQGYADLAKIESHIKRNVIFGGAVRLKQEAYQELRVKACALGGEAVIVDDFVESRVSEMSHVHVWARALKRDGQNEAAGAQRN